MFEDLLAKFGIPAINTLLVGLLVWLIRRDLRRGDAVRATAQAAVHAKLDAQGKDIKAMSSRMECFEKSQHTCQLDNEKRFATKDDVAHIWERVDEHATDIAQIKGALGK